jgi:hypothetical protein
MKRALQATAIALTAAAFTTLSSPSQAATCSIRLEVVKGGFIFGASGGGGTMTCGRRSYRLNVGGLNVGTFGASGASVVGRAYNVRRPSDVSGTYVAAGAGVAVIRGAGAARLQNPNGVVLEVRSQKVGLEASLNLSGLVITVAN